MDQSQQDASEGGGGGSEVATETDPQGDSASVKTGADDKEAQPAPDVPETTRKCNEATLVYNI